MNSKVIYIASGVLAFGIIFVLTIILLRAPKKQTLQVSTKSNETIPVNDITKNTVEQIADSNLIARTPQYDITYYGNDRSFLITLNSEPLSQARQLAEADLVNKLGITSEKACQVIISVKVPYSVNEFYAGQELGLSFCPNAVQLQ